ncbi:uncharacterized protein LAESUDRAFT_758494 [Laetiporus sulphureus 93-53]|uniref:Uncharacterized protein n=1 Tax=Laetiporus sulphureus 93-53 TaxID=1314785 RepID=A0A165EPB8_9APHY|nr:uncharacterized protein LAESUDRAFT_758494 [Laetiporus sulphureus 93-53]KZT07482.1 hypothetical protein LAESUDRAFT_758494 [Laetiporus sulphureus 93-53]
MAESDHLTTVASTSSELLPPLNIGAQVEEGTHYTAQDLRFDPYRMRGQSQMRYDALSSYGGPVMADESGPSVRRALSETGSGTQYVPSASPNTSTALSSWPGGSVQAHPAPGADLSALHVDLGAPAPHQSSLDTPHDEVDTSDAYWEDYMHYTHYYPSTAVGTDTDPSVGGGSPEEQRWRDGSYDPFSAMIQQSSPVAGPSDPLSHPTMYPQLLPTLWPSNYAAPVMYAGAAAAMTDSQYLNASSPVETHSQMSQWSSSTSNPPDDFSQNAHSRSRSLSLPFNSTLTMYGNVNQMNRTPFNPFEPPLQEYTTENGMAFIPASSINNAGGTEGTTEASGSSLSVFRWPNGAEGRNDRL